MASRPGKEWEFSVYLISLADPADGTCTKGDAIRVSRHLGNRSKKTKRRRER